MTCLTEKNFDDLFSADETWGKGTMIDVNGVHVFNPHNAYEDAEDVSQWGIGTLSVTSNAGTAPDNTVTADLVENTTTSDACSNTVSGVAGETYGCGVFIKTVSADFLRVQNIGGDAWIDLATGDASYVGNTITATVTALSDGWFHVYTTGTITGSTVVPLYSLVAALGSTTTTVGEQAYLWGAHVYRIDLGGMADHTNPTVAAVPKYIKTTGTARYLARKDHYEAGVRGFLIEPDGATNLLTQSGDISHADWGITGTTSTGAVTTIRGIDLTRLTNDGTSSFRYVSQGAETLVDDDIITASAFISGGNSENLLQVIDGAGTERIRLFIAWAGGVASVDSTSVSAGFELMGHGIKDMGGGMYRAWISGRNISGGDLTSLSTRYYVTWGTAPASGGDEYLDLGGLQTEKSQVVTSYIPTLTAAVSRGAETITVPADVMDGLGLFNSAPTTGTNLWPTSPSNISEWVDNLDGTYTKTAGVAGEISDNQAFTDAGAYEITFTITGRTAGEVFARFADNAGLFTNNNSSIAYDADGTYTVVIGVLASNDFVGFQGDASFDGTISNVTVKEIHRRSIGVNMVGGISYADVGLAVTGTFFRWRADADNFIRAYLNTFSNSGTLKGGHKYDGTTATTDTISSLYAAGFNTAFNIAAVYEDARINAAQSGTAANSYVDVAAMPDLTGSAMGVCYDGPAYHITKFEIFGENAPASDGDFKMDTVFLTEVTS